MSLTSDKNALNKQINELNKTDSDAKTFNQKLEKLIDAISDNIQCASARSLIDAVDAFKDRPAQNMGDSNINGAIDRLQREVKTIEAAIEAQKRAAEALRQATLRM